MHKPTAFNKLKLNWSVLKNKIEKKLVILSFHQNTEEGLDI